MEQGNLPVEAKRIGVIPSTNITQPQLNLGALIVTGVTALMQIANCLTTITTAINGVQERPTNPLPNRTITPLDLSRNRIESETETVTTTTTRTIRRTFK